MYAIAAALLLSLAITATQYYYLLIFTLRLPVFVLGIYAGYAYVHKQQLRWFGHPTMNIAIALTGIVGLSLVFALTVPDTRWRLGLWWYPFMLLTYPFCVLIAFLCERMDKYVANDSILKSIRAFVVFCGTYSLEIFLLHLVIFRTFPAILRDVMPRVFESRLNTGRMAEYGVYVLLSLWVAPLVARLASFCTAQIAVAKPNVSAN